MHLLLVEDDLSLSGTVARGLREAGFTVDLAATGPDAFRMATTGSHDAIVLDVRLPGMDGLEVCRRLRAAEYRAPILMLTALDAVEQRIAGLDSGADDYLSKPFEFGELLARLRAILRRQAEPATAIITVGDLTIDTRSTLVRRGPRAIALTAKEYAFLLLLARNAGRVVSRAELMSHVWDEHRPSYTNVIDVYASRLRRKVDDGEATPLFVTLRGTGYLLSPPADAST
ncbi:MAG: response regulator transcription factor [Gemmatimonadetes bacterium]|nr:response regulator transcription factor [Gemmatimonadota bacterium]